MKTVHVLKASEGGPSRDALIRQLRDAGVPCRRGPRSCYVGHVTIEVLTANKRLLARAGRITGTA